jgi:hypothetical protein
VSLGGYSHILIPVTKELLDWAQECEVPISSDIPNGREPTDTDIAAVLESLHGYTIKFGGSEDHPHIQVDSIEMVDWYYEDPDPVMNRALGGPRRSPKQSVTIRPLQAKDQTRSFSFQGDIALIIRIAQELARRCGPLAAFATCDGIPAIFLPDAESPIWQRPWL